MNIGKVVNKIGTQTALSCLRFSNGGSFLKTYNNLYTKCVSLLICSLIITFIYFYQNFESPPQIIDLIIYLFLTLLVILFLGLPISLVIDWISSRYYSKRRIISKVLHSTVFCIILLPFNFEEFSTANTDLVFYFLYFSLAPLLFCYINIFLIEKKYKK